MPCTVATGISGRAAAARYPRAHRSILPGHRDVQRAFVPCYERHDRRVQWPVRRGRMPRQGRGSVHGQGTIHTAVLLCVPVRRGAGSRRDTGHGAADAPTKHRGRAPRRYRRTARHRAVLSGPQWTPIRRAGQTVLIHAYVEARLSRVSNRAAELVRAYWCAEASRSRRA